MYGVGSMMASGLIVDGLHAFGNDLWSACSTALGIGEPIFVDHLKAAVAASPNRYKSEGINENTDDKLLETWLLAKVPNIKLKRDWVRRTKQFARRYFDDNVRKMTYCLKDVNNIKLWHDLHREYVEVDYTQLLENSDNTIIDQTIACAGGSCDII
jgi:ribonucleoside-diphosphate reductase alpha chain